MFSLGFSWWKRKRSLWKHIGAEDVKARLANLKASVTPMERHCASELCRRDGADPEKPVRGFPLWLHYIGTVRNVLIIMQIATEYRRDGH